MFLIFVTAVLLRFCAVPAHDGGCNQLDFCIPSLRSEYADENSELLQAGQEIVEGVSKRRLETVSIEDGRALSLSDMLIADADRLNTNSTSLRKSKKTKKSTSPRKSKKNKHSTSSRKSKKNKKSMFSGKSKKSELSKTSKSAKSDCAASINGGGWTLVRHCPAGKTWHTATDQLKGTQVYGKQGSSLDKKAWSIRFDATPFEEFLFATGDCKLWLVAKKSEVTGSYYLNKPRQVIKSSLKSKKGKQYSAKWSRRLGKKQDPVISLENNKRAISTGTVVYSESSAGGERASVLRKHKGANVYVRQAASKLAAQAVRDAAKATKEAAEAKKLSGIMSKQKAMTLKKPNKTKNSTLTKNQQAEMAKNKKAYGKHWSNIIKKDMLKKVKGLLRRKAKKVTKVLPMTFKIS